MSKVTNVWHRRSLEVNMFDKLVVSEPDRAGQRNRKSYFVVSSVVVGILFITAVVISIFAEDFGLGNNGFELSEIITPPDLATAPQTDPARRTSSTQQTQTQTAIRTQIIRDVSEEPFNIPPISTTATNFVSRPAGYVKLGTDNVDPILPGGTGRDTGSSVGNGAGGLEQPNATVADTETTPPPPIRNDPPRNVIRSIGVANGKATFLPKPQYPATANAMRLEGKVDVQVMIDEKGNVTSAKAVSGHPFFRVVAEQAARSARFTPTLLSNVPVKVTGVIVYNFTRN